MRNDADPSIVAAGRAHFDRLPMYPEGLQAWIALLDALGEFRRYNNP